MKKETKEILGYIFIFSSLMIVIFFYPHLSTKFEESYPYLSTKLKESVFFEYLLWIVGLAYLYFLLSIFIFPRGFTVDQEGKALTTEEVYQGTRNSSSGVCPDCSSESYVLEDTEGWNSDGAILLSVWKKCLKCEKTWGHRSYEDWPF